MEFTNKEYTKKYILENFDQIELFSKYFKLEESAIRYCLDSKTRLVINPLRNDNKASLGFMWNRHGKILMNDFGDGMYKGDIFDLVATRLYRNTTNSKDFIEVCKAIVDGNEISGNVTIVKTKHRAKDELIELETVIRGWNNNDVSYWNRLSIPISFLETENVRAVDIVYSNGKLIYDYLYNDECYCYYFGTHKNTDILKLYIPQKTKGKRSVFITNNRFKFEYFNELTEGKLLVLIKSSKDKILFKYILTLLKADGIDVSNISVVPLTSEVVKLNDREYEILSKKYTKILFFVDNDKTGLSCAEYHKTTYNLDSVVLGQGEYSKIKEKDLSDHVDKHDINSGKLIVTSIIQN